MSGTSIFGTTITITISIHFRRFIAQPGGDEDDGNKLILTEPPFATQMFGPFLSLKTLKFLVWNLEEELKLHRFTDTSWYLLLF